MPAKAGIVSAVALRSPVSISVEEDDARFRGHDAEK
jgi:hypothetical protein